MYNWLEAARTKLGVRPAQKKTIIGYHEYLRRPATGRALVSYVVAPLVPSPEKRNSVRFSNPGIAQCIPQALNELGYEVDIVDYDCTEWRPRAHYDLFIGHGGVNFEQISCALSDRAVQIYFSSGIYWREFSVRGAQRILDLAFRSGYLLPPDRRIDYSEEYANQAADGIICLGNQDATATYAMFKNVIAIKNGVYPVMWAGMQHKDYQAGRQHFLFFSGGGNVHKGLDLLLEAFVGTSLHLHVCQPISNDFVRVYRKELTESPNIHVYGHIPMRSSQYEMLASKCNWVISATCAEGQPGAVLECMGYGLIPILPSTANIDLGSFGVPLPDCKVDTIRKSTQQASQMPTDECKLRSEATAKVIRDEYSPACFLESFKDAVHRIVDQKARSKTKAER